MFAEGRDQARYNSGYAEQRDVRVQNDQREYRGRDQKLVRDRDDRGQNDGDRNRTQYRDNDAAYRYNSFRR